MRGRGAGGAQRVEPLRSRDDLRLLQLARLCPQFPAFETWHTPGPTLQAAATSESKVAQIHCLWAPLSNLSRCVTPAPASLPPPPPHLLIGVICVQVTAKATRGAGVTRARQGLGGFWEARLPCALQKGGPASYLFPTPVAAALPGPTAFPLPPQAAGSASPTGATPRLGGAHP